MSRRTQALIIWLIGDILLFVGGYALAYFLRVGFIFSTQFPVGPYLITAILVSPFWLSVLIGLRTFALMKPQKSLQVGGYLAAAAVLATSLFVLAYYFAYGLFFSRLLLVYVTILTFALSWIWHIIWELLMRKWFRNGQPTYPTLMIGATREAASLIRLMKRTQFPLMPVSILDGKGSSVKDVEGVPVEGKLNKFEETIDKHKITHLIQCSDLEQSINILSACRERGITYLLLPSVLGIVERDERVESFDGIQMTVVRPKKAWWTWFFN